MTDETPYLRRLFAPEVRGYLIAVGACLALMAAVPYLRGAVLAAAVPVAAAALGLLLRWPAMPGVAVAAACYLLVYPSGFPTGGLSRIGFRGAYFSPFDVVFVTAAVGYLAAQFRLYSLTHRAAPPDRPPHLQKRFPDPPRRPAVVRDEEIPVLGIGVAIAVLAGQLVWLFVTKLRVTFEGVVPLRLLGPFDRDMLSRFALFLLLLGGFAVVARFVLWYWRLARMSPAEARLVVVDTGWSESRRELARLETWRAWGRGQRPARGKFSWRTLWYAFVVVLCITAFVMALRTLVLFI